jgi:hypothetical protein
MNKRLKGGSTIGGGFDAAAAAIIESRGEDIDLLT